MGMHVFSLLKIKNTLKRNLRDKSRDADWDFGARQSPPDATDTGTDTRRDDATTHARHRRSTSADEQRRHVQAPTLWMPQEERQQQQHGEHKRVSASVGADNVNVNVIVANGNGNTRGPRGVTDGARARARLNGPRSGSPEGDVLLAAGESAKELRTATKPSDQRRRGQPIALVAAAPRLPDAASVPLPLSPTSVRSFANSPTPSMQSFQSVRSGRGDGSTSGRTSVLAGKRSMPQLHNVWENFLEEAAEDVSSFTFPMPPQSPSKFTTVHVSSRSSTSIDGKQSLRHHHHHHHHTPTSSSSSASTATTSASVSTVKTLPRKPLPEPPPQPQATTRSRRHLRASHHTSSSTSSTTASITGSTSSMAAFSSASSMTTMHDDCDDGSQTFCDDPVPATPRSGAAISPKSFRFADQKSSGPPPLVVQQPLRKSPTTPALLHNHQNQSLSRVPSPSSSTSSESHHSTAPSFFHSQSSTPTPSSVCPTPSPTHAPSPTSRSKHADRVGPAISKSSGPYRRAPESELPEQPLYPGSFKGRKSLSNFYRHSSAAGGSRIELGFSPSLDTQDEGRDWDEDVLSELGYYGPTSSRAIGRERRQSALSTTSSLSLSQSSSTHSSSELPFVPPQRRSSRQLLSIAGAQSAPPGESMLLPRAKSVSNIKHEANAPLPKRPQMTFSHSSQAVLATNGASSDASRYPHAAGSGPGPLPTRSLLRARSQALEQVPTQPMMRDESAAATASSALASVPHLPSFASASRSGQQGRLRSGSTSSASAAPSPSASASTAHYHTHNRSVPQRDARALPVRPPPAPPLDMGPTSAVRHPTMVGTRGSATPSPLTPSSVQWGYAL